MKIYFTTHATSMANENNLAAGWEDAGLSEKGRRQALERRETIRDKRIDLVCCSDLKRAVDTVDIAFGKTLPVIVDERLREINYGELNGRPVEAVRPMKKERIKEAFPGGESYEQAAARVRDFVRELVRKYPDSTVLIIGHRATRFGLDTFLGGKTLDECLSVPHEWQPYWEYTVT